MKHWFHHVGKGLKDLPWPPTWDQVQFPSPDCKANYSFNFIFHYFSHTLSTAVLCAHYTHKIFHFVNLLHQIAIYYAASYSPFWVFSIIIHSKLAEFWPCLLYKNVKKNPQFFLPLQNAHILALNVYIHTHTHTQLI